MAKLGQGFITGANAKIKAFSKTMAYCSDVSYNITVQTIPVETMGKYEVHANEPVAYTVDGTFSIVRYTKNSAATLKDGSIVDQNDIGNGPSQIQETGSGSMGDHLNPAKILGSATFDLEIHEKRDYLGTDLEAAVFIVSDCRVTRRGMTLNKRGVMVDNYAYVGILAGDKDVVTADEVGNSSMTDGKDLA
jgi:hypothetical protein